MSQSAEKGKGRYSSSCGTPTTSELYGTSLAIWDQTVLPVTYPTQLNTPHPTPCHAGWYSITYPGGMEG